MMTTSRHTPRAGKPDPPTTFPSRRPGSARRAQQRDGAFRLGANLVRGWLVVIAIVVGSRPTAGDVTVVVIAAVVALSPLAVERVRSTRIPGEAHLALAVLPLAEATGRILRLYEGHPVPYDVFAHAAEVGSAVMLVLLAVHYLAGKRLDAARTLTIALVAATCIAVAWEAIEAVLDQVLPTTLQHGIDDTLLDIAAGMVGAVIAASMWIGSRRASDAADGHHPSRADSTTRDRASGMVHTRENDPPVSSTTRSTLP